MVSGKQAKRATCLLTGRFRFASFRGLDRPIALSCAMGARWMSSVVGPMLMRIRIGAAYSNRRMIPVAMSHIDQAM